MSSKSSADITPSLIDAIGALPASATRNTLFVADDGSYAAIWNGSSWVVLHPAPSTSVVWELDSDDSSGTPGAAVINKPSGRSAIAIGASSVVITNNLVTPDTKVFVAFHFTNAGWDVPGFYAFASAGSFQVGVGSGSGVDDPVIFDWFLINPA